MEVSPSSLFGRTFDQLDGGVWQHSPVEGATVTYEITSGRHILKLFYKKDILPARHLDSESVDFLKDSLDSWLDDPDHLPKAAGTITSVLRQREEKISVRRKELNERIEKDDKEKSVAFRLAGHRFMLKSKGFYELVLGRYILHLVHPTSVSYYPRLDIYEFTEDLEKSSSARAIAVQFVSSGNREFRPPDGSLIKPLEELEQYVSGFDAR